MLLSKRNRLNLYQIFIKTLSGNYQIFIKSLSDGYQDDSKMIEK